ncbi:MAG: RNase H family protein [Thermodesulfobacteriota bacterium]
MLLFTDGSVSPQSGLGYGAFVAVNNIGESLEDTASRIRVKRFFYTSSARLEIETLLWSLCEIRALEVDAYTDSRNILSLLKRRAVLEQNSYCTKSGKPHGLAGLYRDFFAWTDSISLRIIKVSGHRPANMKNKTDRIFSLVDKASRTALRAGL